MTRSILSGTACPSGKANQLLKLGNPVSRGTGILPVFSVTGKTPVPRKSEY
jgi:hypothetical protein